MEGIRRVVVAFCLVLGLAGCTCTLASCGSDEAQWSQRFEVEFYESHGPSFAYMAVDLIADTETGSIDWSL